MSEKEKYLVVLMQPAPERADCPDLFVVRATDGLIDQVRRAHGLTSAVASLDSRALDAGFDRAYVGLHISLFCDIVWCGDWTALLGKDMTALWPDREVFSDMYERYDVSNEDDVDFMFEEMRDVGLCWVVEVTADDLEPLLERPNLNESEDAYLSVVVYHTVMTLEIPHTALSAHLWPEAMIPLLGVAR